MNGASQQKLNRISFDGHKKTIYIFYLFQFILPSGTKLIGVPPPGANFNFVFDDRPFGSHKKFLREDSEFVCTPIS